MERGRAMSEAAEQKDTEEMGECEIRGIRVKQRDERGERRMGR